MKRSNVFLCCALMGLLPTACSSGLEDADGPLGDSTQTDVDHRTVTVSGRVELFPEAAHLLAAQGQNTPGLAGLTVTLEEPLGMGVKDVDAVLGEGLVGADQAFSVPDVLVRDIHLSLAGRLEQPGYVRSSTVLLDTALTRTLPSLDIGGTRVWALPDAFHDALTRSIGEAAIRGQSEQRAGTLRDAGFVLGRVVNASGAPVAGAQVVPEREDLAARIYYPSADFQGASQSATSTTGLFVYVHSGGATESFQVLVKGPEGYLSRNVAATPGSALVLTLAPGDASN